MNATYISFVRTFFVLIATVLLGFKVIFLFFGFLFR